MKNKKNRLKNQIFEQAIINISKIKKVTARTNKKNFRHNSSIFGWAGHSADGRVFGNVTGFNSSEVRHFSPSKSDFFLCGELIASYSLI